MYKKKVTKFQIDEEIEKYIWVQYTRALKNCVGRQTFNTHTCMKNKVTTHVRSSCSSKNTPYRIHSFNSHRSQYELVNVLNNYINMNFIEHRLKKSTTEGHQINTENCQTKEQ